MSTSTASTEEVLASALFAELRKLVKKGSSGPSDVVFDDSATLALLQDVLREEDRMLVAEFVVAALERALANLPANQKFAFEVMLGRSERTSAWKIGRRRQAAGRAMGVQASTFRVHNEPAGLSRLARQMAVDLLGATKPRREPSIMRWTTPPLSDSTERWCRWTPELRARPAHADVARAVAEFEGPDTLAGRAAADWLKNDALDQYPASVTHLCIEDQRVSGFFAISGGVIELNADAASPQTTSRLVGASVIERMARHRDAGPMTEPKLILYAAYVAQQVADLQGNIALVLDAATLDEPASVVERYGFRRSADDRRLWIPLQRSLFYL